MRRGHLILEMTETIEQNSILACYFTQVKLELAKDGNEQLCVLMELFRSKGSTDIYMKSLPSNSVKKLTLMGKNSLLLSPCIQWFKCKQT